MRRRHRVFLGLLLVGLIFVGLPAPHTAAEPSTGDLLAATPMFEFHSNFWINLNHYLFKMAGASGRTPIANGQLQLVDQLSSQEAAVWDRAIRYYAQRHIENDIRTNDALYEFKRWVIELGAADVLQSEHFDSEWLNVLNAVKPIYREHFWSGHDTQNRTTLALHLPLIEALEEAAFQRLASLARAEWPAGRIRVDISYYSNWSGAYTTTRPATHILMSSVDIQPELNWLELLFHEACHSMIGDGWNAIGQTVDDVAAEKSVAPPRQLWHALLFYICGRVVQDALARRGVAHELYMVDKQVFTRYHAALREHFEPYIEGVVDLRAAVSNVIAAVSPDVER